ncbi:MAG TPA: hypothetical protein DDY14_07760 [Chromatiaceae bacterium]|jgi:hypothetical protein|nr:MAG: hypothetical protein N838_09405 [Thiohalocapsa sp. PB-PSB1]HBG95209.1 hypothetical protein [Chromatiaceae bacterium]
MITVGLPVGLFQILVSDARQIASDASANCVAPAILASAAVRIINGNQAGPAVGAIELTNTEGWTTE